MSGLVSENPGHFGNRFAKLNQLAPNVRKYILKFRSLKSEVADEPGKANAECGFVVLDGPNGIAVTMTPEAADETAANLVEAARRARSQNAAQLSNLKRRHADDT